MNRGSWTCTPIIVVGMKRSGTKWLCNEIGAHPEVASIQDERHGGIIESNLLTEYGRSFNLESDTGYAEFLSFWKQTHFFSVAQGDLEWFERVKPRPANSVEALRYLMDWYAAQFGKTFWVQKVAPVDARHALDLLRDARVVAIRRHDIDTVKSNIRLDARRGMKAGSLRAGMSQGVQSKQMRPIINRDDVLPVRYESLKADRDRTMAGIFGFIGLEPAGTASRFSPNTSFGEREDRDSMMGFWGGAVVRMSVGLCKILPLGLLESLQRALTRGRPEIIPGTFAHQEP